jgi:hypothetical protein
VPGAVGTNGSEVAAPALLTGLVLEKTSAVQAGSLKSRKVMVPVLGPPPPTRMADSVTAVPSGPPPEGVATMVWVALRITMVKVWQALGATPLLAQTVVGP